MINTSNKFKDMMNGGSERFTIKEILVEFIREQNKVNEHLVESINANAIITKENSTSIYYIKWIVGILITIAISTITALL